jgi:hypothetical protein
MTLLIIERHSTANTTKLVKNTQYNLLCTLIAADNWENGIDFSGIRWKMDRFQRTKLQIADNYTGVPKKKKKISKQTLLQSKTS